MNSEWMLLTDIPIMDPRESKYDFKFRPILPKKYSALVNNKNQNYERAKKCIENAKKGFVRFVYYEVSLVIEKIPSVNLFVETNIHRSAAILDFGEYDKTKRAKVYAIESSIDTKQVILWKKVENIINHSLIQDIKVNLGINCDLITYDMDMCPRINIQQELPTCALWSIFLFFIFVFYPNRNNIFTILSKMDHTEKNKVLGFFIYYYGTKFNTIIKSRDVEFGIITNYYKKLKF